jgi:hypothetical protein
MRTLLWAVVVLVLGVSVLSGHLTARLGGTSE